MKEKKLVVCWKHWTRFSLPGLPVILLLGAWVTDSTIDHFAFPWIAFPITAFLIVVCIVVKHRTTYIMLTDRKIVVRQGIIFPRIQIIPRIQVQGIEREYTVLGLVFGYRTIKINCWGKDEPDVNFKYMTRANEFASALTGRTDEEKKLFR